MYNMDGMSNIRVHNNVINKAYGQGIVLQNGPGAVPFDNIQIYKNQIDTIKDNWPGAGILVSPNLATDFTNLKIKHNTFSNLTYGVYFYGDNSSYVKSPQVTQNDFLEVQTPIRDGGVTSPKFSNNYRWPG